MSNIDDDTLILSSWVDICVFFRQNGPWHASRVVSHAHLHVLDVLLERHELVSPIPREETAELSKIVLHILVFNHTHLDVLAEIFPLKYSRAVGECGGEVRNVMLE